MPVVSGQERVQTKCKYDRRWKRAKHHYLHFQCQCGFIGDRVSGEGESGFSPGSAFRIVIDCVLVQPCLAGRKCGEHLTMFWEAQRNSSPRNPGEKQKYTSIDPDS